MMGTYVRIDRRESCPPLRRAKGASDPWRIPPHKSGAWLDERVSKRKNEMRDPVHDFVYFDPVEQQVIDSRPFQRLRHIHQLALSSLVYPGASHKRFEHSVGVMEVVGRIFDTVTRPDKLTDEVRDVVPQNPLDYEVSRSLLRIAALCHDIGHLPFSHAAEDELLPEGYDHERMTFEILHSEEMCAVWRGMMHKPDPDAIAKIALGPRKVEKLDLDLSFTPWEAILAEMLVGDSFGADRIDYLLRDSLHTGATYGTFDHHRLIQTLRILPAATGERDEEPAKAKREPQLGVEHGGLEAAEGLWIARYFMFGQLYYHPARLIYDQHLKDFLAAWLPGGRFKTDVDSHLALTDAEITVALRSAARDPGAPGHDAARRIIDRDHFRVAYQRRPEDGSFDIEAIYKAVQEHFGQDNVRYGGSPKRGDAEFPVLDREGRSVPAVSLSPVLDNLPVSRNEYIFTTKESKKDVEDWIEAKRDSIIEQAVAEQEEGEEISAEERGET
jgi:HD superfamily phosphohydrolase